MWVLSISVSTYVSCTKYQCFIYFRLVTHHQQLEINRTTNTDLFDKITVILENTVFHFVKVDLAIFSNENL